MEFHFLDLVMYLVFLGLLWKGLEIVSNGELTTEIGGVIGLIICMIYTVLYILVFVRGECNWVDIFNGQYQLWFKFKLKM